MVETRCFPYESQFLVGIKLYLVHRNVSILTGNEMTLSFFSPKTIIFKYHLFNNYVNTLESKL